MHSRPPGVSPLTLVLPHPPLPRRRSSLLSLKSNDSAPRTPRGVGSPVTSAIFCAPSRRSTDSWNSSNADDLEWEWKPDQVMLLSRTLDALPTHLVTPFNGPIPPANLLDKIARGVSDAKGPVEWPHSLRATRVKLIELSRLKAKEEAQAEQRRNVIAEEPEVEIADADGESNYSYMHNNIEHPLEIGSRRPPYRQSSMDFMDPAGVELKNTASIARLSRRLQQRSDRVFSPYGRRSLQSQRRSTSPPPLKNMPSLISPSTQSSDTLDSLDSFSDPGAKRRSVSSMASSMSIISDRSTGVIPVPRVQRIRSDSVSMAAPPLPPKDRVKPTSTLKRAPSYGAVAQEARKDRVTSPATRERRDSGSYPSSDEEEKIRTKHAKKQRTKSPPTPSKRSSSPTRQAGSATPPPVPEKDRLFIRGRGKSAARVQDENSPATSPKAKKAAPPEGVKNSPKKRPNPMSLQRNPSIFGPELPKPAKAPVQEIPASPVRPRGGLLGLLSPSKRPRSPSPVGAPLSPLALSPAAPTVPDTPMSPSPKLKTLRRVKRLGPGRRISFGSMLGGGDDEGSSAMGDQRSCLGSAFQLI